MRRTTPLARLFRPFGAYNPSSVTYHPKIKCTIQAQEKERERIAKDLHDSIGSKLNVVNLGLYRLEKSGKDNQAIVQTASEMIKVVHDTIDTTRRISHDLLPPTLANFGLKEALVELCESLSQSDTFSMALEVLQNEDRTTDKQVELNLFRVVQELVNNSIKHSGARYLKLQLWLSQTAIKIEYQDDGKGFELDADKQKTGLGMQNIESRLNMIDASFNLKSAPGQGMKFATHYHYPI